MPERQIFPTLLNALEKDLLEALAKASGCSMGEFMRLMIFKEAASRKWVTAEQPDTVKK